MKIGAPVTVLYRGDLYDTASLIGLANARAPVGLIAFTGNLTADIEQYCKTLNPWLRSKGLPSISTHPELKRSDLDRVVDRPHIEWGWNERECKAVIFLAGLPLPPTILAS